VLIIIVRNARMSVQFNIQFSQSSAATNVSGCGKFYSSFMYGSSLNTIISSKSLRFIKLAAGVEPCFVTVTADFFVRYQGWRGWDKRERLEKGKEGLGEKTEGKRVERGQGWPGEIASWLLGDRHPCP